MKTATLVALTLCFVYACEKQAEEASKEFPTPFEISQGVETATYNEAIDFYLKLAKAYPQINIQNIGQTDSGLPLHLVTYNKEAEFNFAKLRERSTILLINNGIHPGESDGIDATMLLFRDLASGTISPPEKTVVATIPVYNIGGALNRNGTTRANQNGPESYGFRGNAKNYDLNRDFIKSDSKNARTFARIFQMVQPDVFMDNHVSNGADYQYTLTHLFTQHNKLGGELGKYVHQDIMPALETSLARSKWDVTPYVNVHNKPPDAGFEQFMDHPRYSTGYAALWNTVGLMVETHMLKPYKKRVRGNYLIMRQMITVLEQKGDSLKKIRRQKTARDRYGSHYPTAWGIDSAKTTPLLFKGYRADTVTSQVTGFDRLKYNRDSTYTKPVTYYNYYRPKDSVKIPHAYIVKKAWDNVINLLQLNQVNMHVLAKDTLIAVESYAIKDFKTVPVPYEGHYLHYTTIVDKAVKDITFREGDVLVTTDQPAFRYILETLEPQCVDSFFNWNFFDSILQQKEGFSAYVFEDTAQQMLEKDTLLRKAFQYKKETEPLFAQNANAQLNWLFKNSPHYEEAHGQYPVYRVLR